MAVLKNLPPPSPLFDTLEQMSLEDNLARIRIPDTIPSGCQDYQHAWYFLYSYRGSPDTFASYRREIERLLQWSWMCKNKSLTQLNHHDIEAFIEFCQHPPTHWITLKRVMRFHTQQGKRIPNSDWRPFVARQSKRQHTHSEPLTIQDFQLSQKAVQAIFAITSSFFSYLLQEDYVTANPVAQIRQKSKFIRKQQHSDKIRRLSVLQWSYVIETAEIMAQQDAQHERTLFIMNALYAMYLRISELTNTPHWTPTMGDFSLDQEGNWWFTTVGKGNKERDISVSDQMLMALKRYRQYRGLPGLPYPGENTPLIPKYKGKGNIASTRQIRNIVQTCFDNSILRMQADNFHDDAAVLEIATVHWLRHTGISDDVQHRPREHVRDDAGHGSSAITDRYIDIDRKERHRSARHKPIYPE